MMKAKGIAQTDLFECAKSGAFFLRTHDGAAPEHGIVHVEIFRRDIEIAAYNHLREGFLRLRHAIAHLNEPLQFVMERRRTDSLSVWRVNGKYAQVIDRGCNHTGLRVLAFIAQRGLAFAQLVPGKNGDAVVRFLAVKNAAITCG